MRLPVIDVAVNIIRAPDGRVLLAERTQRQMAAGFWELPGGKIEAGETPMQAASRELAEEIGIRPIGLRRWISYEHAFTTKRVRLHFFRVEGYIGTPHGREGQRLAWVDPAALSVAPLLPSNARVLAALALPQVVYHVRAKDHADSQVLLTHLHQILPAGRLLLVLDGAGLAPDQRVALARRIGWVAQHHGAALLLAGSATEAQRAGVAGVLSSAGELRRLVARPAVKFWAASCHGEAELARSVELGADAVFLSPVLPTPSHPGRALGWEYLRRLAEASPVAVFARGGLTMGLLDQALQAGAAGVVVSRINQPPPSHGAHRQANMTPSRGTRRAATDHGAHHAVPHAMADRAWTA